MESGIYYFSQIDKYQNIRIECSEAEHLTE